MLTPTRLLRRHDPPTRGLRCRASACTPLELTVDDSAALGWAATCDDRAKAARVGDDGCHSGAALWSAAFRRELDRCLTLAPQDADLCVKSLGGPCSKTYF